jgi:hypothetical protein
MSEVLRHPPAEHPPGKVREGNDGAAPPASKPTALRVPGHRGPGWPWKTVRPTGTPPRGVPEDRPPGTRPRGVPGDRPRGIQQPRLVRRLWPILATIDLLAIAMLTTLWWAPDAMGTTAWWVPHDLWGTLVAANRLAHLDLRGLYTQPTGLISFPGTAMILVPAVAVIDAARLSLHIPGSHNPHPATWLVAGPYAVVISSVALFAADAFAEHLGATRYKRALLAAAGAVALWSVSARWGHPEDAVAVGLLLYGVLALSQARPARAAWLIGAAVAVQPLVLLALPVVAVAVRPRQLPSFLARAAVPSAVLLGAAAAANWHATIKAVANQPNWPTVDHPTPWMFLAPHVQGGAVSAGPARALTVVIACACAAALYRRWRTARDTGQWSPAAVVDLLWWTAFALALRSVFEPVMVPYYVWPSLAVALIAAALSWRRLIATSAAAVGVTFLSQATWHGQWLWWGPVAGGVILTLIVARFPLRWPLARRRRLPLAEAPDTAAVRSG